MRIDNNGSVNRVSGIRPKSLLPVEGASGSGGDSVEVSSRAADFRTAMEALTAAPEVREGRIAEISQQLAQGTLSLDGSSLAEKLLEQP
jgi:negative regulator of flagellin synthesis FlgM